MWSYSTGASPCARRTCAGASGRPRVGRAGARLSSAHAPWAVLTETYEESRYRADESLVFCHPALGTPLDPSKLAREYMRPALARAKITKPFRPWHDLRHTSLTHEAAAGNPQAYVQLKAGHSQGTITERYIHAAQVLFPGAAERGERRLFAGLDAAGSESGSN
jgi:integrase